MDQDQILKIGINDQNLLFVIPASQKFPFIYRAGMEIDWDRDNGCLYHKRLAEWSYLDWFKKIIRAAKEEYGVRLEIAPSTEWQNISADIKMQIEQSQ